MNATSVASTMRYYLAGSTLLIFLAACNGGQGANSFSPESPSGGPLGRAASNGQTEPNHVLTADYFGSIFISPQLQGSTNISAEQAAQYLTWAEVLPADQPATEAAQIRTLFHYNPTFQAADGPLYGTHAFAYDCNHELIKTYSASGVPLVLMNRDHKLALASQTYINGVLAANPYDLVFEDDAGLSPYNNGLKPCGVSASEWIGRDAALEQILAVPQLPSSLNAFTESPGHVWTNNSQSVQLALQQEGGLMEQCYSSNSNPHVFRITDTLWTAEENTEITVNRNGKLFFCYVRNYDKADERPFRRIYDYASFLLTYKLTHSVLWETYQTRSNFHVLPESGLVALEPRTPEPTDISQLDQGGAYVREYRACYYRGSLIGPCASVVNPSSSGDVPNPIFRKYHHTLTLQGGGVVEGGTATFSGASPPENVPAAGAFIAFL
jgi:hypothetical protein